MVGQRWDVPTAIAEFNQLLNKYPDHPKFLLIFTNFLRQFLRSHVGEHSLPSIEIMTILKHEKPVIHSLMRRQKNSAFSFLTQIEMDLEQAKKNLEEIVSANKKY